MLQLEVAEEVAGVVQHFNLLLQLYLLEMVRFNWVFLPQVLLQVTFFYQAQLN
jgi:hypothetical protein